MSASGPYRTSAPRRFGAHRVIEHLARDEISDWYLTRRDGEATPDVLRILGEADEPFLSTFLHEADALSALDHRALLRARSFDDPGTGVVGQLVDAAAGWSLSWLSRVDPPPPEAAVWIALRVLDGLDHLHDARGADGYDLLVVHRHVAPGHVLITAGAEVKLEHPAVAQLDYSLRAAGVTVPRGFDHLSPEQVRADAVDRRSDLYLVGLLLYRLLTGCHPFRRDTAARTVHATLRSGVLPPSELVPDLPKRLDAVVMRAMRRDPAGRPGTAAELAYELSEAARRAGLGVGERALEAWLEPIAEARPPTPHGVRG